MLFVFTFRGKKSANLALFHLEASFIILFLCLLVMTPWLKLTTVKIAKRNALGYLACCPLPAILKHEKTRDWSKINCLTGISSKGFNSHSGFSLGRKQLQSWAIKDKYICKRLPLSRFLVNTNQDMKVPAKNNESCGFLHPQKILEGIVEG